MTDLQFEIPPGAAVEAGPASGHGRPKRATAASAFPRYLTRSRIGRRRNGRAPEPRAVPLVDQSAARRKAPISRERPAAANRGNAAGLSLRFGATCQGARRANLQLQFETPTRRRLTSNLGCWRVGEHGAGPVAGERGSVRCAHRAEQLRHERLTCRRNRFASVPR